MLDSSKSTMKDYHRHMLEHVSEKLLFVLLHYISPFAN